MDPKIVEAVISFKEIKNARQAKSWLGLCGYYRKFCEGYTDIVAPLRQTDEQGREFVCEYFGRALRKHEKNYSVSEKELFSVVETAARFRIYLASQKCKIIVDHRALTLMDHLKSPTSPRLQRWAMFISQFSHEIVYKKGRLHFNADRLSRMTYEPKLVPTPAVTDALMDDNFVNGVDLGMREIDFIIWLVQIANKEKESYQFGSELLYHTAAIDDSDGEGPPSP